MCPEHSGEGSPSPAEPPTLCGFPVHFVESDVTFELVVYDHELYGQVVSFQPKSDED